MERNFSNFESLAASWHPKWTEIKKLFFMMLHKTYLKKKFCTDNFYSLKLWFSINQPRPPKWGFKKYFLKGPCTKNIQFKFQQNWFINGWVVAIWKNSITLPNFAHPLSIYHDPTLKMPSSLQIQTLTSQPFIVWFALNLDWIFLMSMPFDPCSLPVFIFQNQTPSPCPWLMTGKCDKNSKNRFALRMMISILL